MTAFLESVDRILRRAITTLCMMLLVLMVLFSCYTVVMRSIFDDPPFWGDTVTMVANVWLVLLALALSIRERQSIAMQMIYDYIPQRAVLSLEILWNVLFSLLALLLIVNGYQVAERIPGAYWELGNLPKGYLLAILPISGILALLAAVRVLAGDIWRWRTGAPPERGKGGEVA